MFRQIGPPELIIILLIIVLLFGAKKLPETARGLGRSLRIFKAETKGLQQDDEAAPSRALEQQPGAPAATVPPPADLRDPAPQPRPHDADR